MEWDPMDPHLFQALPIQTNLARKSLDRCKYIYHPEIGKIQCGVLVSKNEVPLTIIQDGIYRLNILNGVTLQTVKCRNEMFNAKPDHEGMDTTTDQFKSLTQQTRDSFV